MNQNINETTKDFNFSFGMKTVFLLLLLIPFIFISACTQNQSSRSGESTRLAQTTEYILQETPTATQAPTATISLPAEPLVTPSRTMDPLYDLGYEISYTQGPVVVSSSEPEDPQYLYKSIIVTVTLEERPIARAFLNLDDLSDNAEENSDIGIARYMGMEYTYSIYPLNNAYYFKSDTNIADFDSCLQYFPVTGLSTGDYDILGDSWPDDNAYCVLTDQNRIAVINYVQDSLKWNGDYTAQEMSLRITVYNKIVE